MSRPGERPDMLGGAGNPFTTATVAEMPQTFDFVVSTRPFQHKDRTHQKMIRTHVMRNLQRNQEALNHSLTTGQVEPEASGQAEKMTLRAANLDPIYSSPYTLPLGKHEQRASSKVAAADRENHRTNLRHPTLRGKRQTSEAYPKPTAASEYPATAGDLSETRNESETNRSSVTTEGEESQRDSTSELTPGATILTRRSPLNYATGYGPGPIDPFDTLPVALSTHTAERLDVFYHGFSDSWCPVNPQSGWFSDAMTDPALFFATLYHSPAFGAYLRGETQNSTQLLEFRGETIRLVNERLNQPTKDITDKMIASVAIFANMEATYGTVEGSKAHVNGLNEMLRLRGGVDAVGLGGLLKRLILWLDQTHTISNNALSLMYPPYTVSVAELQARGLPAPQSNPPPTGPEADDFFRAMTGHVDADIVAVLRSIRGLRLGLAAKPRAAMTEDERRLLNDRLAVLERHLITTANDGGAGLAHERGALHSASRLGAALRIAAWPALQATPAGFLRLELLPGVDGPALWADIAAASGEALGEWD